VWLTGVLLAALPLAVGAASLARLRAHACRVEDGPMADLLRQLTAAQGLRRHVLLLQSDRRSMPMTWGLLRPVILLPRGAETWPPERLCVVLQHELAHVCRWDCLTQLLAHVVRALHWFNPLAWLAVARMRVEQERACDDAVLAAGAVAPDYAEHLLSVTTGLPASRFVTPVALAMGRAQQIESRLVAILDPGRERRPPSHRTAAVVAVAALALLVPLAATTWKASAADPPAAPADKAPPESPQQAADQAKELAEVRAKLLERYVKQPDAKALSEGAIKGMIGALHDPYTEYFTPEEEAAVARQISGGFTGIGAQLRMQDKRLVVVTPLEDSPSLKAGLKPGDVITAIDGKAIEGVQLSDAIKQILGEQGTLVKLKVVHPDGQATELAITRAPIRVRTVQGFRRDQDGKWEYLLDADNKIGYVNVLQFGGNTTKELREVAGKLGDQKIKGLILDLRFCPGGLLSAAVDTAKMFLAKGTIVTVKGRDGKETVFQADGQAVLGDVPLLVLVNEYTASAAEIVAGALRDNDRATLLGTRTYGKGSVQEIVKLGDEGGALKLTSAYYYLPGGRNIQKRPGEKEWGVDPTDGFWVALDGKQIEALQKNLQERAVLGKKGDQPKQQKPTPEVIEKDYADPQLAAALKAMLARVTKGEFEKVGKSDAAMRANLARIEEIQARRKAVQQQLERIDKELEDSEKAAGKEKPKEEK
jgi:carboxyl-terminal processing protease